jgi:hypothetical protein
VKSTAEHWSLVGGHGLTSGSYMVHRHLLELLPLFLPQGSTVSEIQSGLSFRERFLARTPPETNVTLLTSSPLPLRRPHGTIIPIVYDLHWKWTRGRVNRLYRRIDLARTVHRSPLVLTISETVQRQLRTHLGDLAQVEVIRMGPGQFEGAPFVEPSNSRTIILIGRKPHKENEAAARLLVRSEVARRDYSVCCISVSEECRDVLMAGFPKERLKVLDSVSSSVLLEEFVSASVYIALGTSEGFGLPYAEAAYVGCDVIAPRQTVVTEALQGDDWIAVSAEPSVEELDRALCSWDFDRVCRLQTKARQLSWSHCASDVIQLVASLSGLKDLQQ